MLSKLGDIKRLASFISAALVLITVFVALFSSHVKPALAAAGINQQLSFTGKIVKSDGTNISDGTYNMEFKIYQDGNSSGTGSTLKWTEDWLVGHAGGIAITSGTFQVNLGAGSDSAALDSAVNWNQSVLWLSLQIGNTSSCTISTTFQSNCGGDGEMTPYIRLTAVPQAFNAENLGGLAYSSYVQLSPGSPQSGSVNVNGGLTIGSGQSVTVGSTAGSSIGACTGSQVVTGFQTLGGIVVGGTCSAQSGGGSLASSYNSAGTSGNTIALSNSGLGVIIQDASSSTITNLFAVQNNGGTSTYLAVTAANSGTIIVGNASNKITIASGSITTASGTLTIDTGNASTLNLGNTQASIIQIGHVTSAPTFTLYAATNSYLGFGSSLVLNNGVVNVGTGYQVNGSAASGNVLRGNGTNFISSALDLSDLGAAAASHSISNGDNKQTWQWSLSTTSNDGLLINESAASTATGSSLVQIDTLASSTAMPLSINNVGNANAFLVQDNSVNALSVDSSGSVHIGSPSTDTVQILLQLDSLSTFADTATCSTTTNQGAMYYNTNTNAIRACINGAWEDLASTAGLGIMLFGVVPDSGNNPGDLLSLSATAHTTGPCKVSWLQNAGASQSAEVSVAPCVAYSGGRKVVVANTTTVVLDGSVASEWEHLCFTTSGTLPTTLSAGTSTETNTTNDPDASYLTTHQGSPILCLADIQMTSATGTSAKVNAIYDIRTFTTSIKEFATSAAAMALGVPAAISGANVTNTSTTAGQPVEGIVVATDMSTSATAPNVILSVEGPTFGKGPLTGVVAGDIVENGTTAGRLQASVAATGTLPTTAFSTLGISRSASPSTACATTGSAADCDYSLYFFQSRR